MAPPQLCVNFFWIELNAADKLIAAQVSTRHAVSSYDCGTAHPCPEGDSTLKVPDVESTSSQLPVTAHVVEGRRVCQRILFPPICAGDHVRTVHWNVRSLPAMALV